MGAGEWILQELNNSNKGRDLSRAGEKECRLEKVNWTSGMNCTYVYIYIVNV